MSAIIQAGTALTRAFVCAPAPKALNDALHGAEIRPDNGVARQNVFAPETVIAGQTVALARAMIIKVAKAARDSPDATKVRWAHGSMLTFDALKAPFALAVAARVAIPAHDAWPMASIARARHGVFTPVAEVKRKTGTLAA